MNRPSASRRSAMVVVAPWVFHFRCGIGGGVLCFRMLKSLSEHYDIHWVSFDVTSHDVEAGKRALAEFCSSVTTLPLPPLQPLWRARLRQLAGGAPVAVQRMASPDMAKTIRDAVQRAGAAVTLFQFPQVAQYLPAAAGVPTVMDVQDVCMVSMHRQWRKTSGFVRRLAKAINWYSSFATRCGTMRRPIFSSRSAIPTPGCCGRSCWAPRVSSAPWQPKSRRVSSVA